MSLREFRQLITKHFDIEELRTLCFDLNVDYDSLRGEGKAGKVRELIALLKRNGRLPELVEMLFQQRPNIDWNLTASQGDHRSETVFRNWVIWLTIGISLSSGVLLYLVWQSPFDGIESPTTIAEPTEVNLVMLSETPILTSTATSTLIPTTSSTTTDTPTPTSTPTLTRIVSATFTPTLLPSAATAPVNPIYSNDFDGSESCFEGIICQWTDSSTTVTPSGRRILGPVNSVNLILTNLPAHEEVTVSFDLFIIHSWDGNGPEGGPDIWELTTDNGLTLIRTTFSNTEERMQAFPGAYPGGNEIAGTGARATNTLGSGFEPDTVYKLSRTFSHSADSVVLRFAGLTSASDEIFGLDTVEVVYK